MADNVNIEAKLCSYVEGDLDPAGRAEIERYLEANPQYRPILEELVRTRGELRALPRVKAPVDLQENLSGQLERSALLGDESMLREVGRRSSFPYVRAWAAVLLLTAALAAVVYSVLPAKKAQMPELASLTTNPVDITALATTAPTSNLAEMDAVANQTVAAMSAPLPAATPATQLASAQQPIDRSLPNQSPTTQAASLQQTAVAQSIVVPATDLPAAEAQVHAYLQSQNYSFGSTSAPDVGIERPKLSIAANQSDQSLRAGPLGHPETRMIVVHQLTDLQIHQTRQQMESIGTQAPVNSSMFAVSGGSALARPMQGELANASNMAGKKLFNTQKTAASMPSGEADLNPGQTIYVTAEDTGLGGITAMDENMTIDADGNVTLPLVGKLRASGMPPSALSRSIALAYEIAKSPTRAIWTIRPVPTTTLSLDTTNPSMAAARDLQLTPSAVMPSVTRPSTSVAIDQTGQGGASLMDPEHLAPTVNAAPPSTDVAATTMPSEPRTDLTIVLVATNSPTTVPSTTPSSDVTATQPTTTFAPMSTTVP